MSAELATVEPVKTAAPVAWVPSFAVAIDEMVARVDAKHDFFKRVMREGEHYGAIPGTTKEGEKPKKVLLKPGAELLLASMALFPALHDEVPPVKDYSGSGVGEGEALIAFQRACSIYRQTGPREEDRALVARASGFCSSRESKYRYRNAQRVCPECLQPAIIKGKKEYGGGLICFGKKGGCGAKFRDDDTRITQQEVGRIPNPDIADVENTILKMADKRAMVAATLLATGCSDIFTQDIEEDEHANDAPRHDVADAQFREAPKAKAGETFPTDVDWGGDQYGGQGDPVKMLSVKECADELKDLARDHGDIVRAEMTKAFGKSAIPKDATAQALNALLSRVHLAIDRALQDTPPAAAETTGTTAAPIMQMIGQLGYDIDEMAALGKQLIGRDPYPLAELTAEESGKIVAWLKLQLEAGAEVPF